VCVCLLLTLAGLGAAVHAVVDLQLTLQGVHELPALTELLLQEGGLVLQPAGSTGGGRTHPHRSMIQVLLYSRYTVDIQ